MTTRIAAGVRKAVHHVHSHAGHAEHLGFVGYALCEVTGWHAMLYTVSLWLFVTGLVAVVAELRG